MLWQRGRGAALPPPPQNFCALLPASPRLTHPQVILRRVEAPSSAAIAAAATAAAAIGCCAAAAPRRRLAPAAKPAAVEAAACPLGVDALRCLVVSAPGHRSCRRAGVGTGIGFDSGVFNEVPAEMTKLRQLHTGTAAATLRQHAQHAQRAERKAGSGEEGQGGVGAEGEGCGCCAGRSSISVDAQQPHTGHPHGCARPSTHLHARPPAHAPTHPPACTAALAPSEGGA